MCHLCLDFVHSFACEERILKILTVRKHFYFLLHNEMFLMHASKLTTLSIQINGNNNNFIPYFIIHNMNDNFEILDDFSQINLIISSYPKLFAWIIYLLKPSWPHTYLVFAFYYIVIGYAYITCVAHNFLFFCQ